MTGNLKLLINFVWKFLGTVRFRNDHVAAILGFGDLQWGNILIYRVYFVEGLGHNLFSVGQFCDSNLEVAFRRNACFVKSLEGVDLLKGDHSTNLYTINLHDMASASPICLMARASSTESWLWHQRLSHLNFDTINDLAKNDLVSGLPKFKYHKEHLCPSSVCFGDCGRLLSLHLGTFSQIKDEAPDVIKTILKRISILLQSSVIIIRTDNDTKFKNQVLKEYFDSVGISYQVSSVRTPQQNGVAERRNRTLVEVARIIIYNRRSKKIIETMNVTFDELSAMDFEQRSSNPMLQSELDLLFEAMYDDYIGGQPLATPRTVTAAQAQQDHPLEKVIGEPSRPVLTINQLRSDGMYALTVSTMEPKNVKEAMTDPAWIESMQEELLQFKRLDHDEEQTVIRNKSRLVVRGYRQEKGFIDADHPRHVYKLKKALYGLKQAPRAWRFDDDILVVQVYIDDIIFSSTHPRPDIVHATCLCAQYQAKPTEKHLKKVKRIFRYLRGTVNTGLWYTKDSGFELTGFLDADYAGCKDTFKSTSGGAQFLGEKLVSWSLKKQDYYGFNFKNIPIYCDLKSAIAISCNPVQHSRTKHIVVRYNFIKEHMENGTIELYFIKTDYQLADIFTKALPADRFNYLVHRLGIRSLSPQELDRLAKSQ
nr:retrovirus-related Pol polyprotein from transposon TNT 1-94 [Tanacetum cinerariifolium]